MRIELRSDSVVLDGYVNAVGRDSRPINTSDGRVNEQIMPGTFRKALERAERIDLLLDHNKEMNLGSTKENLQLFEDNIGLRAVATVTNPVVIEKARKKLLKGWSFGMYVNDREIEERADNIPRRIIKDIDMFEVSIIDEKMNPCYTGTSIEQRADEEVEVEQRSSEFRAITEDLVETPKKTIDYSKFENRIKALSQA